MPSHPSRCIRMPYIDRSNMITEEQVNALYSEIESSGENQAKAAYRTLEEMIVTLQLPPGSKISEKALNRTL